MTFLCTEGLIMLSEFLAFQEHNYVKLENKKLKQQNNNN